MKKLIAALAAAAMLCCTLVSPVSAEESYLPGDVNLDGVVDCVDSQILLMEYAEHLVDRDGFLTPEQRQIGNVDGKLDKYGYEIDGADSMLVLRYYAAHLVNPDITMEDVLGFQPVVSEAINEFAKNHKLVWDDETGRYAFIEV